MTPRMVGFVFVVTILWVALHIYMDHRLIRPSRRSPGVKRWARVALALLVVLPLATMIVSRTGLQGVGPRVFYTVGFLAMGGSGVALVLLLAVDGVRMLARLLARKLPPTQRADLALPSRRGFFGRVANLGVVGTAGGVTGLGYLQVQRTPAVQEVDVPVVGLPAALDGFSIAQLSDIHIGPTLRGEYLRRCVEVVNGLGADVVAVTGDLIDGFVDQLAEEVVALGELQATHGVYFVTGNHEYYWDGPAWCEHVASLGLKVLLNEHVVVERGRARLLLAGCTDHSAGNMVPAHASDPAGARRGAPACDVSVLLAHQPRSIYEAAKAGYDLQISGHTHGGQYFPMNILVHLFQPYVAGLALHDRTWIYVSRGTGYWGPPMRLGAPSEITLLRLRRAEPTS